MRFITRKRHQAPAIIIVSLIDILIVLLIFMMVTTTFRTQPAVKLVLPESSQPREGASEANLVVTVTPRPPYFYLGQVQVTPQELLAQLNARKAANPHVVLSIRADTEAPWGKIVTVMDAAKAAGVRTASAYLKHQGAP
jgi:biopolymer transport protein ExbD